MKHASKTERFLNAVVRLQARLYTLLLRPGLHSFGSGSVITPPLRFHDLHRIEIGRGVLINGYCWIQSVAEESREPSVVFGDHCQIGMNATISAARKIMLGEYVLLGRNVYISDHGHDFSDPAIPIMNQPVRKIQEISIGAQTWIGQNAVVLPGAQIGRHCVIGANAVVNTVIPDCCVAAGIPARVIRGCCSEAAPLPETVRASSVRAGRPA